MRTVRRLGVLLITLSGVTPAASVFIMGQQVIAEAGTGAFLSFIAAALLGLATAYVYAELSSAFPVAGGEYSIIGRTVGPSWGFMALGLNLVGGGLGQAVTALGLAAYLQVVLPGAPALPTALAATLGTTLITVLNIRVNALITGLFLGVELLAIGVLTGLGVLHAQRPLLELVTHPVMIGVGGALAPASLAAIGMATAAAIYAYNGYGGAVFFGEEMHEARTHMAWVVFWSLAIAVIAELAPISAVLVGAGDLKSLLSAAEPLPAFVGRVGGPWLAKAVSLGVAFAIVNAMIAIGLINARQLYCSARDKAWPASVNRALAAIHPRFNSPWVATLAMGVLTAASCLLDLKLLVMLTANGLVMIYAGVSVAAIAGRTNGSTAGGAYRMPFFPLAPAVSLFALAAVAVADLMDPQTGRPSLIANLAVMALFAAYWAFYLRRRGGWALTGADGEVL
ncbi:MAG TPA: APC family permease [Caulobacteraceae bacterium]|nr:APC family permease [Caulobacteraceae bacterium]